MCSQWRWRLQQHLGDPAESLLQNEERRGSRPDRTQWSARGYLQTSMKITELQTGYPEGSEHITGERLRSRNVLTKSNNFGNILGLMVSIGTKMFFRAWGEREFSSNFTGEPDTSPSCFCALNVDSDPVNCWSWGSDLTGEKSFIRSSIQ